MKTHGLNFEGAPLYSLPWYFIVPLLAAAGLLGSARILAHKLEPQRLGRRWLITQIFYLSFSTIGAFLMFLGDDPSTATMFWIALIFYGLMVINPILELMSIWIKSINSRKLSGPRLAGILFNLCLLMIATYSWLIEPYDIEVNFHQVSIPGAPEIRIVQISDIQAEYLTSREIQAAQIVKELQPDLVAITGDCYTGTRTSQASGAQAAAALISSLNPPLGIFAVSGSSNPTREDKEFYSNLGAVFLQNQSVEIRKGDKQLILAGLDYISPDLEKALGDQKDKPAIVLYHSPSIAFSSKGGPHRWTEALPHHFSKPPPLNPELKKRGANLILTGHTHGGQVNLPFFGAILTGTNLGREFVEGIHHLGPFSLYINRGLGMDGRFAPKIRFLARPEIAVFDIKGG